MCTHQQDCVTHKDAFEVGDSVIYLRDTIKREANSSYPPRHPNRLFQFELLRARPFGIGTVAVAVVARTSRVRSAVLDIDRASSEGGGVVCVYTCVSVTAYGCSYSFCLSGPSLSVLLSLSESACLPEALKHVQIHNY